jgi:hypothetical protein
MLPALGFRGEALWRLQGRPLFMPSPMLPKPPKGKPPKEKKR